MNVTLSDRRRALASALGCAACVLSFRVGTAVAADPVQARQDLKAMGVDYTEQNFAKVVGSGDMIATRLFLDAGMDVNAGGGAAIGLAAGRGQTEMVRYLLSKGARPTPDALTYARTRGHKDVEKILLDAGATEGRTR